MLSLPWWPSYLRMKEHLKSAVEFSVLCTATLLDAEDIKIIRQTTMRGVGT